MSAAPYDRLRLTALRYSVTDEAEGANLLLARGTLFATYVDLSVRARCAVGESSRFTYIGILRDWGTTDSD